MNSYTFRDQDVRIVDRDVVGYSSFYGRNLVTDVAESSILTEVNSQRIGERRMGVSVTGKRRTEIKTEI